MQTLVVAKAFNALARTLMMWRMSSAAGVREGMRILLKKHAGMENQQSLEITLHTQLG